MAASSDQSSQICLQSVKKSPSLQHSRKYIAGESTLSPGETTSYSGRNDFSSFSVPTFLSVCLACLSGY